MDISDSTCITKIIDGLESICDVTSAFHFPEIEVIRSGLILLNDFSSTINVTGKMQELNGTFLIEFTNETISIKDLIFSNFETLHFYTKPASYQITPLERSNIKLLSLETLEKLHLNNTKQIELLKYTTNMVGISTGSLILILIFALLTLKYLHRERISIKIQELVKPIPELRTNAPLWSTPQTMGGGVI